MGSFEIHTCKERSVCVKGQTQRWFSMGGDCSCSRQCENRDEPTDHDEYGSISGFEDDEIRSARDNEEAQCIDENMVEDEEDWPKQFAVKTGRSMIPQILRIHRNTLELVEGCVGHEQNQRLRVVFLVQEIVSHGYSNTWFRLKAIPHTVGARSAEYALELGLDSKRSRILLVPDC